MWRNIQLSNPFLGHRACSWDIKQPTNNNSFSFSSRRHRSARKGPYALHSVSQQSLQGCPRNSAIVCLVEHRSFPTSEGGMLAASFLHSYFLQAISAVILWPVHALKFFKPLSTSALPSCRPDVISARLQLTKSIASTRFHHLVGSGLLLTG